MDLFRERRWDLVGRSWLWYSISSVVIVLGVGVWMAQGLNLGVDFTGGAILKYEFEQPLANAPGGVIGAIEKARQAARQAGHEKSQVQVADVNWVIVRIGVLDEGAQRSAQTDIRAQLEAQLSDACGSIIEASDVEFVGPVVGEDLRRGAKWALLLGCGLILVYVSIRYRFRFAVAAICALVHDVLILCGAMALLRIELNSPFVAAILTVIGYSINDTVVIFDRIRENMTLHRQAPFDSTVNASLLQTMARSINTVVTTLFTLVMLFFFGGATIESFALALIIGIASGCYSSIFTASQLLVTWQRMWEAGSGNALWWRAIVGVVPALFLGLIVFPIFPAVGLEAVVRGNLMGQVGVGLACWVIGFALAGYFSEHALRVLAGVAASRRGGAAGVARPVRAAAAGGIASAAAVPESARGLSAEAQMKAASSVAVEEARHERRERRKQRKAREKKRPAKRKKRF